MKIVHDEISFEQMEKKYGNKKTVNVSAFICDTKLMLMAHFLLAMSLCIVQIHFFSVKQTGFFGNINDQNSTDNQMSTKLGFG